MTATSTRMTMAASRGWSALKGTRAPLSRAAGQGTVGASAEEPSYELTRVARPSRPRPEPRRSDAGLGAVEVGAGDRPVELLGRDGRPGAPGPQREVLPVAHVRLSRRHDDRRPALAGRRAGQQVGELGRPPAVDVPPPQGREVPQRRRDDLGGREVKPPTGDEQALDNRLRGAAARTQRLNWSGGDRPG